MAAATDLRPRTRERYESALATHVLPRLGRVRVSELRKHHVTSLVSSMWAGVYFARQGERGKLVPASKGEGRLVEVTRRDKEGRPVPSAGWTIRGTLSPLSLVMDYAVEEGMAAANPVAQLRGGKGRKRGLPSVAGREKRILAREEIPLLLKAAGDRYRALLATAVFTGLRQGELLGLTWGDVDFEAEVVRVRRQLGDGGRRVEPKTPQAVRDVVLMPALANILRQHKLGSPHSRPPDFVFSSDSEVGTPMQASNVRRRGLEKAVSDAGLNGEGRPRLRFHDLRHSFASLLIAEGCDVVFVSRQLGHANPSITLSIYATSSANCSRPRRQGTRCRRPLARSWNTPLARGGYWRRLRPRSKWLSYGSWRPAASGFDRTGRPYKQEVAGSSPAPPISRSSCLFARPANDSTGRTRTHAVATALRPGLFH